MKIRELLRGCTPGRVQSVGHMSLIPLVSELQDDRFVSPDEAAKVSTRGYGNVVVQNDSDKEMIVPQGATWIVQQAAQNHAIPHLGLVKAKASQAFDQAMCVQQSQCGMIAAGAHPLSLLPFPLKEKAHRVRNSGGGFQRLWPDIAKFNTEAGVSAGAGRGHLEFFYDHYKGQLDNFVAEFEPVDNQVGAIVLIDGKVAGIERCPSTKFFRSVWKALIRDCYGSAAILAAKEKPTPTMPKTRLPLKKQKSLASLKAALAAVEVEEFDKVAEMVESVMEQDLPFGPETKKDGFDILSVGTEVKTDKFVGQIVKDGEKVPYASLIAGQHWLRNSEWLTATGFSMRSADRL